MNNIQNIDPNIASALATQADQSKETKTAAGKELSPVLGGPAVAVTQAPASDLEKLVARLKNENDNMKAELTQRRLASVLDVYTARYGELTDQQAQILKDIAANNASIADLKDELDPLAAEKTAADAQMAIMEAKIDELQRAIDRAVAEGKAHRELVAKLKEQLARDTENEDLKAELAKEEAAVALLEGEKVALDKELKTAVSQAAAQEAKLDALQAKTDELEGRISALEASNAKLASQLGPQTVANLLAAFLEENTANPVERNTSVAEEAKAELKAIANDPANLIRDAMDRMDASILRTIDENREEPV